jgi:RNA polymerase sigma factor (sigma-70 family)
MSCIAGVDADTLFNEVLDRLKADSYKVLRDFENRSKLTTYITTIIAHLVIDIKRKIDGRNRIKERAKALGPTGEKLYDLVFIKGYPAPEAYDSLQTTEKIKETFDEFQMIVEKIRGHQTSAPQQQPITKNTPEQDLISKQREELTKKVLNETLSELSNEERLLIRMKFPLSDDEEPKSLSEIGKMLHTTEKAVDSRIRRILTKLKEKMLRHGLSFDDFIDVFA